MILSWLRWALVQLIYLVLIILSPLGFPLAYLMRGWSFNPLKVFLSENIYGVDWWRKQKKLKDGSFKTALLWAFRNPAWNFNYMVKPDRNIKKHKAVKVVKNNLWINGKRSGMFNFAGLKWITKDGAEGWSVNKGVAISQKYSILGVSFVYYLVGTKIYFRYSFCRKLFCIFKRDVYLTLRAGTSDERYLTYVKLQTAKK